MLRDLLGILRIAKLDNISNRHCESNHFLSVLDWNRWIRIVIKSGKIRDDIICLCHAIAETRDDLLVSNFLAYDFLANTRFKRTQNAHIYDRFLAGRPLPGPIEYHEISRSREAAQMVRQPGADGRHF